MKIKCVYCSGTGIRKRHEVYGPFDGGMRRRRCVYCKDGWMEVDEEGRNRVKLHEPVKLPE